MFIVSDLRNLQGAKRYTKIAAVQAEFASAPGILETREGLVPYATSDAILTGSQGERWPVERRHFDTMYEPLPGCPGYYRKTLPVLALQIFEPFRIGIRKGEAWLDGKSGDWAVQNSSGEMAVIDKDIFTQTYAIQLSDCRAAAQ